MFKTGFSRQAGLRKVSVGQTFYTNATRGRAFIKININRLNQEIAMKFRIKLKRFILGSLLCIFALSSTAEAGAEKYYFDFQIDDYNNCTGEWVMWDVAITGTFLERVTPSGQINILDHWSFEGTVASLESSDMWSTKGRALLKDRWSINNSYTGGFFIIENSVMKPLTPETPSVRLDIHFRLAFNAEGELVVERDDYIYSCVGQ